MRSSEISRVINHIEYGIGHDRKHCVQHNDARQIRFPELRRGPKMHT